MVRNRTKRFDNAFTLEKSLSLRIVSVRTILLLKESIQVFAATVIKMNILVIILMEKAKIITITTSDKTNTMLTPQQLPTTTTSEPTPTMKQRVLMIIIKRATTAQIQNPTITVKDNFIKTRIDNLVKTPTDRKIITSINTYSTTSMTIRRNTLLAASTNILK